MNVNSRANTSIINKLRGFISEPLYQHLISRTAIEKLKSVINQPFTANSTQRMRANNLASYFANASKAFHSGKGDDYESVAVVYGNPALPISLSDAGLVSNRPLRANGEMNTVTVTDENTGKSTAMKCNKPLWEAMKANGGGHYITVNLDISDLITASQSIKALKGLVQGGKGSTRVQIDYLILVPPGGQQPFWKVFILELKAGKTHLEMDPVEEQQMAKAEWVFKNWLGNNTQVELLYHPFLADDVSFARNLAEKHTSMKVTYLTLNGVCQFLNLDPKIVTQIGSMRARYRGSMGTFEGALVNTLFKTGNNARRQIEERRRVINAKAVRETVEDELEDAVKKSNILSKSAQNILAARGTSIQNVFGGKLGPGVNITNANWKPVVQYISYLILKREELNKNLRNSQPGGDTAPIIMEMHKISRQILKMDSNRGGKILRQDARSQLDAFVKAHAQAFRNLANADDMEMKTDYLENYIKLRAKALGRQNSSLNRVSNASKTRRPSGPEITAAAKVALNNWKAFTKSTNANYIKRFEYLRKFWKLDPKARGNVALRYTNSLKNTYGGNSTVIRVNAERAISKSNAPNKQLVANEAISLLKKQKTELENILKYLESWTSSSSVIIGSIDNSQRSKMITTIRGVINKIEEEIRKIIKSAGATPITGKKRAGQPIGNGTAKASMLNKNALFKSIINANNPAEAYAKFISENTNMAPNIQRKIMELRNSSMTNDNRTYYQTILNTKIK